MSVLDEALRYYVLISNNSCKFLLSMVDDILDLSKIELDQFELNKNWFNLVNSITDLSEIMGQQVKMKNLEFKLEIGPGIPEEVFTD
jgi:signal transduction histidine kinase